MLETQSLACVSPTNRFVGLPQSLYTPIERAGFIPATIALDIYLIGPQVSARKSATWPTLDRTELDAAASTKSASRRNPRKTKRRSFSRAHLFLQRLGTSTRPSGKSESSIEISSLTKRQACSSGLGLMSALASYAALGLLNTPNPRMSGGLEPLPVTPFVQRQQQAEASTSAAASAPESSSAEPSTSSSAKIPKGYARLIRDEEGNVVDVEFAQEEDAGDQAEGGNDSETAGATPWGQPLHSHEEDARPVHLPADHGVRRTQGIPMPDPAGDGIHVPHKPRPAPTAVVQGLSSSTVSS